MHVKMIKIILISGIALKRWKNAVKIMMDKEKGSPHLHRLRVIQLMESYLNFCLSIVFVNRMMEFSTKYCGLSENKYGSRGGQLCQSEIIKKVLTLYFLH